MEEKGLKEALSLCSSLDKYALESFFLWVFIQR